ncbi:MAG: hypothetical protein H6780_04605 [Candidatus Nomurabacteria bacterium]|nr:MAG: hypothetical protein H6780_04605 [Candidatus Nomurabacteria bacterium]
MFENLFIYFETFFLTDASILTAFMVWAATISMGEIGGLLSITMALQGHLHIAVALFFTFLGSLSADVFWYGVTRFTAWSWLKDWFQKRELTKTKPAKQSFFALADKYPYVLLLFIKFMVGMRLVLTIYVVAKHQIPFAKYLFFNVLANVLFIGTLFGFVLIFSQGMTELLDIERGATDLLISVAAVFVVGHVISRLAQYVALRLASVDSGR